MDDHKINKSHINESPVKLKPVPIVIYNTNNIVRSILF